MIADVQMPGMTGPELYSRLVASGQPIPTILITAYPDQLVRTRALQSGVECYLAKPFREEDLLDCIQSALNSCTLRSRSTARDSRQDALAPSFSPGEGPVAYGPHSRHGVAILAAFSTKGGRGEVSAGPDGFLCRLIVDSPGFE